MEARNKPRGEISDHITVGENDFQHLTAGWHSLERVPDPIRWTSKASDFLIRPGSFGMLFVETTIWGKETAVLGRVQIEGMDLGGFRVEKGHWSLLAFRLPISPAGPIVRGRILIENTWSPAEEGLGADTRQLGIAVRRIWTMP